MPAMPRVFHQQSLPPLVGQHPLLQSHRCKLILFVLVRVICLDLVSAVAISNKSSRMV